MKTFNELTERQQKQAINFFLIEQVKKIVEYGLKPPELEEGINRAIAKTESLYTPWFIAEHILEECREDLTQVAKLQAKEVLYNGLGEPRIVEIYEIEQVEIDEEEEEVAPL